MTPHELNHVVNRLEGVKVLIVDDDEQHAVLFGMLLEAICGATVTVARSFMEACALIDDREYDALLVDYRLDKEGNGVDLLRKVLETRSLPFTALMSATSIRDFKPHEQAFLMDHNDIAYLEKPFVFPDFIYQVAEFLAESQRKAKGAR